MYRAGKGYFGVGVERISKPMNLGNLFRSAHAFGASFLFTVNADYRCRGAASDTSRAGHNLPFWGWESPADMALPRGCALVGVELTDDAVPLPSFRHPRAAAYVFGPELGSLSADVLGRCDERVVIPTRFCINLAAAGVVVMYDRMISLGRFAERPVGRLAAPAPPPAHVHGSASGIAGG